jgi:hypothetical protein
VKARRAGGKSKAVRCHEVEARSKGPRMLSSEVRDFSLPLS